MQIVISYQDEHHELALEGVYIYMILRSKEASSRRVKLTLLGRESTKQEEEEYIYCCLQLVYLLPKTASAAMIKSGVTCITA